MSKCLPFLLIPLFTGCAVEKMKEEDPGIPTTPYHMAEPVRSLDGVKIPVMRSAELERKWGKPRIVVLPDGGYSLSYSKPGSSFETLRIYGAPGTIDSDAPEPPPYTDIAFDPETRNVTTARYPQKWNTVTLIGRPIHYYLHSPGGGADAPQWSTVTFPLHWPDGPSASYRIMTTSNLYEEKDVQERYLKTVTFQ